MGDVLRLQSIPLLIGKWPEEWVRRPLGFRAGGQTANPFQQAPPVGFELSGSGGQKLGGGWHAFGKRKNVDDQVFHGKVLKRPGILGFRRDLAQRNSKAVIQMAEQARRIQLSPFRLGDRRELLQTLDDLRACDFVAK